MLSLVRLCLVFDPFNCPVTRSGVRSDEAVVVIRVVQYGRNAFAVPVPYVTTFHPPPNQFACSVPLRAQFGHHGGWNVVSRFTTREHVGIIYCSGALTNDHQGCFFFAAAGFGVSSSSSSSSASGAGSGTDFSFLAGFAGGASSSSSSSSTSSSGV